MRKPYPTDLSDAEWNYIEPHMPAPKGYGRPRIHDLREILNAVFYVLKSGCQWRLLPHDFPRWPTVYHYFRKWRIEKAPGRGSTGLSANALGFAWGEIHSPVLG
jgi:putative transposase